ncbi:hypothetical protein BDV93DRAFT_516495 [Ceratobasidium sp. AG-I]|nr:hypothetical protein BDV93DRAFT_516495 [Ceratobasidium sp. AG-I]
MNYSIMLPKLAWDVTNHHNPAYNLLVILASNRYSIIDRLLNAEREIAEYQRRRVDLELEVNTLKQAKTTDLLVLGNKGGRDAAQTLRKHIISHCNSNADILINVFLNQNGLKYELESYFGISHNVFYQFLNGFSSAPCISIVDVGKGKEAADAKIRELVKIFARNTDVEKLYFGGEHDNGYASTLAAIENEGYLNKIVLLRGYNLLADEIKAFDLTMLRSRDLFLDEPLPNYPKGTTSARPSPAPQQHQLPPIQQELRASSGPAPPTGPEASKVYLFQNAAYIYSPGSYTARLLKSIFGHLAGMPDTPTQSALGLMMGPASI